VAAGQWSQGGEGRYGVRLCFNAHALHSNAERRTPKGGQAVPTPHDQLVVRVPAPLGRWVRQRATEEGLSVSTFVRSVLTGYQEEVEPDWDPLGLADRDPGPRFVALVRSALRDGHCHVTTGTGGPPQVPDRWGWRDDGAGRFRAQGTHAGWIYGDDVYLIPTVALAAAKRVAAHRDSRLSATTRRVAKSLHSHGLLASTDLTRGTLTVRHQVAGSRFPTWHIRADRLRRPGSSETSGVSTAR
jgi:hypothetical protein